jgi:predicted nucleic acid-binding Zn ribbon protein
VAQELKEILNKYFQGKELKKINETIAIEKIWNEIVGDAIKKNTKIISFKNKTLIIKTSTPVWRNEISLQKTTILKKLQTKISQNKIKLIKLI